MDVQKDMAAFEAAMVEAGYHEPERNQFGDGYLYGRDADRYVGWMLAVGARTACDVMQVSSRVCEYGTKGCVRMHKTPNATSHRGAACGASGGAKC